ncbi:MAG: cbb3-type cytochrome oxidase assembly protein CcoS [Oligoflexia bacterium]|nr:cbb3-type cytochrome oxidase assembly protein CcoS [Oligoflexia bacterium]
MSIFVYITGFGLFIFIIFLTLLVWSIRSGQMDELDLPAEKVLWEDHRDT